MEERKLREIKALSAQVQVLYLPPQAECTGSSPVYRSSRSTFQAIMEMGVSPPECEVSVKAFSATLLL